MAVLITTPIIRTADIRATVLEPRMARRPTATTVIRLLSRMDITLTTLMDLVVGAHRQTHMVGTPRAARIQILTVVLRIRVTFSARRLVRPAGEIN